MDKTIVDRVLTYTAQATGIRKKEINLSHQVEKDFGFVGLDTIIFYENFFEEFQIKNPNELALDQYISSEGLGEVVLRVKGFFSRKYDQQLKKKDISIQHLIKVVEKGGWFEPSE